MKKVCVNFILYSSIVLLFSCAQHGMSNDDLELEEYSGYCGDNVCFIEEVRADNCPEDCSGAAPVCGNGICSELEDRRGVCERDCGPPTGVATNNQEDSNQEDQPCIYPSAGSFVEFSEVHPSIGWEGAYLPDGSQVDFTMEKWYCDNEYQEFNTIAFVLGTGWCPACPSYIEHVNDRSETLYANGMMVVYVEAQDSNFDAASNEFAYEFIGSHIGDGRGLRVGDGETLPAPGTLIQSPVVQAFPSSWIVRRGDLVVIASQSHSEYILPFEAISLDPNSDEWNGRPVVEPNCGEEDEEIYEASNDDPQEAPVIEPGSFSGGICSAGPDFYKIDIEGSWQVDLEFEHSIGDLDLFLWDSVSGDIAKDENNRPIGSDSITDHESFEWQGLATVVIIGYNYNTTTYSLTLTGL